MNYLNLTKGFAPFQSEYSDNNEYDELSFETITFSDDTPHIKLDDYQLRNAKSKKVIITIRGNGGMKDILRKVLNDNGVQISEDTTPFQTNYIKVINSLDQAQVFDTIKKYRKDRYHTTATAKEHEGGWINRLEKLEYVD